MARNFTIVISEEEANYSVIQFLSILAKGVNANELLYKDLEEFIANLSREEYVKHEAAFKEVQTLIHQKMRQKSRAFYIKELFAFLREQGCLHQFLFNTYYEMNGYSFNKSAVVHMYNSILSVRDLFSAMFLFKYTHEGFDYWWEINHKWLRHINSINI